MKTLTVELGARAYPIRIGGGLLAQADSFAEARGRRLKLITDENVARYCLPGVSATLKLASEDVLILPAGEIQKTWQTAEQILDWLLSSRLARDGLVIALGGGVIGDMAGFASAIYQRGVDFIQIPTTLLAQVDSSVGGKTGVNHPRGKNMIGAFHQPCAVVADTDTLKTLPRRELQAGIAEVVKYGMLADAAFFGWLEQNMSRLMALDADALTHAIQRSCELKALIVAKDEREAMSGGPRALLNLGHTFGHAIETWTGYGSWLHGEAVATGLCMAAVMSQQLGWLTEEEVRRCTRLVAAAGLPVQPPSGMTADAFISLMARDKKVAAGQLRLVLMKGIGDAVLSADFDPAALRSTLDFFTR